MVNGQILIDFDAVSLKMLEKHLTQEHTPRHSAFVSFNLDPDLPPKKLYSNLRQLGVIYGSDKGRCGKNESIFCNANFASE
jgi:hypothetical protein